MKLHRGDKGRGYTLHFFSMLGFTLGVNCKHNLVLFFGGRGNNFIEVQYMYNILHALRVYNLMSFFICI